MKLTSKARGKLPGKVFAGPNRSFPINDANHAKAALIDVNRARGLSSGQKAKIKSKARGMLDNIGK